jgi:DMSO/TMAO reductase YedYZ molybdopterin-dependent catalytic subunit
VKGEVWFNLRKPEIWLNLKKFITVLFCVLLVALVACVKPDSPISHDSAGEAEATEFEGKTLTPLDQQPNNAHAGFRDLDKSSYRLSVDGLMNNPLSLTYADLMALHQESRLNELDCVDGWNFVAKWTGPQLNTIFKLASVQPEAKIAIFYTADLDDAGYTSLDLSYITDNQIIIALKINDLTLPYRRGFPFQVVAQSKFGYKWAKWVKRIELSSDTNFRGYWENGGYNNNADVTGPVFDR